MLHLPKPVQQVKANKRGLTTNRKQDTKTGEECGLRRAGSSNVQHSIPEASSEQVTDNGNANSLFSAQFNAIGPRHERRRLGQTHNDDSRGIKRSGQAICSSCGRRTPLRTSFRATEHPGRQIGRHVATGVAECSRSSTALSAGSCLKCA